MGEAKKAIAVILGIIIGIFATWQLYISLEEYDVELWIILVLGLLGTISASVLLYKFSSG